MGATRAGVLEAFGRVLPEPAYETFDELLPVRPWREAIAAEFWLQTSVMETIDGPARHSLHESLVEVVGADAAAGTMEYLPPVPWRVLREHGLDHLLRA